jgi:hypothetical protein
MAAWTDDEIELLKRRYATTPGDELARLIGRSRNAVQVRAHRLGLERGAANRSTPATVAYGLRRRGIVFSSEHRAKLSRAHKGRKRGEARRPADVGGN